MEHDSENSFEYETLILSDRNESDLVSSSFDDENILSEDEEKKITLIYKIVDARQSSVYKIIHSLRYYLKLKLLKKILVDLIIEKRTDSAHKIQKKFKYYMMRKLVKEIIEKEENFFTVYCSIKQVNHLDLKVYLPDDQFKIFPFEFCKLRNMYVLYIPRSICKNCVFKVNFIADGKIVIDPMYKADYDSSTNGMFYNIIDFNKIEKVEKNQKEDKERVLKYHKDKFKNRIEKLHKYKSEYICSSSDSDQDDLEERKFKLHQRHNKQDSDLFFQTSNSERFSRKNTAPHSAFQLINRNKSKNHHRNSCVFSSPLKSILRSPNSSRTNIIPKRVSFCENAK